MTSMKDDLNGWKSAKYNEQPVKPQSGIKLFNQTELQHTSNLEPELGTARNPDCSAFVVLKMFILKRSLVFS